MSVVFVPVSVPVSVTFVPGSYSVSPVVGETCVSGSVACVFDSELSQPGMSSSCTELVSGSALPKLSPSRDAADQCGGEQSVKSNVQEC